MYIALVKAGNLTGSLATNGKILCYAVAASFTQHSYLGW